jgi:protein TonB
MADPVSTDHRENSSAGHLAVHLDVHSSDVPFLFEQQQKRMGPAFLASFGSHATLALVLLLILHAGSRAAPSVPLLPEENPKQIVWLSEPGPGGGGGGGGNRMKEPPRKAELPGKDKLTVPVVKAPSLETVAKNEPTPVEQLNIPAKTIADSAALLSGALEAPPGPPSSSLGSGSGGGAGTGTGSGIGSGTGSGLGPGTGGGTGGGYYQPGNGVTLPRVQHEERPSYTSDAMRAKVQGTVLLQCVVKPDGTVGDVQVVKSLDPTFGLDQQAVNAARRWRFLPGTRLGEPVSVQITIELTFTLR